MAKKVKSIVLTGNGTNCEREMAHACRLGGSDVVDIVYISEILYGEKRLNDYHFLNLPGGFLDGDDLGSAKADANRIIHSRIRGKDESLFDQFSRFIRDGKLILGSATDFSSWSSSAFSPRSRANTSSNPSPSPSMIQGGLRTGGFTSRSTGTPRVFSREV